MPWEATHPGFSQAADPDHRGALGLQVLSTARRVSSHVEMRRDS